MRPLEPGTRIGDYRIDSLVRSSPSGSIFRAEEEGLGRTVALVVASEPAGSESAERFLATARALAHVDHPNVLPVYEVGTAEGRSFAVTREAAGESLTALLRRGVALAPERAVGIAEQVAAAMDALAAGGLDASVTTDDIVVTDERGAARVLIAPLESLGERAPGGSRSVASHSVARLLASMLTGREDADVDAAPAVLRPVLERAFAVESPYQTPGALLQAAREAIRDRTAPRRVGRRNEILLGGVGAALVAAAIVAALLLTGSDDSTPTTPAAPRAAGHIAATIALGHGPRSIAVGFGSVWVATADGTLVEVDPKAERVVGSPIRFGRADPRTNLTVRAGAGALFVLDGSAGTVTRIDPARRRITARVRLGPSLDGATVSDGMVWITRSTPENVRPPRRELVRLDARRLSPIGKAVRVGSIPLDVEARAGTAWVTSVGEGTVTRFVAATGNTRSVRVATQPVGSALRGATLWVPDAAGGVVVALDAGDLELPKHLIRLTRAPYSAAATDDAVWVTAGDQHGAVFLYRIDPERHAVAGLPIPLGQATGWVSAGEGALWVGADARNALLKIVPATPAPETAPRDAPGGSPATISNGPLAPGKWTTGRFAAAFDVSISESGWLAYGTAADFVDIGRFADPDAHVEIAIPTQLFTAEGSSKRVQSVNQVLELLEANGRITTTSRVRTTLGGRPATRISARALPSDDYPTFCPESCAPLFGAEGLTLALQESVPTTVFVLRHRGKVVVILQFARGARALAQTSALLRSLRFR
jgi:hypothetical protein